MERTCKICDRIFSTPYNLRQHYQRFHPLESQPKLLRRSRKVYPQKDVASFYDNDRPKERCRSRLRRVNGVEDVNWGQYGGRVHEPSDSSDDDADSMTNNVGSDNGSESESESESEPESDVDSVDNEPNWVFDSIIEEAEDDLGKGASLKDIRKRFRLLLAAKIEWYRNLRKNNIFKKIMTTAKELQDGPGEIDREEALKMAISQRRMLLDRLIPDTDSEEGVSDDVDSDV